LVASFNHPGDTFGDDSLASEVAIFESRPADVSRVITHMLEHWKDRQLVDAQSIGAFGFSRGGYTVLALVGAEPSRTASAQRLCGSWRSILIPICRKFGNDAITLKPRADSRVRSIVAAEQHRSSGTSVEYSSGAPATSVATANAESDKVARRQRATMDPEKERQQQIEEAKKREMVLRERLEREEAENKRMIEKEREEQDRRERALETPMREPSIS
jgi:predicted dienelactone hydrolase